MRKVVSAVIVCSTIVCCFVNAEEVGHIVFEGIPTSMTVTSYDKARLEDVEGDDVISWRCVISRIDGEYFWTSNYDRKLVYVPGEHISYFYPVDGGGSIKVMAGSESGRDVPFVYSENFDQYDYIRTFWGAGTSFVP